MIKKINIIVLIIALLLGVYLGSILIRIPYLSFSNEIDLVELGNLFFMVILTILVPVFIGERLDKRKSKKSLINDYIRQFEQQCTDVERSITQLLEKDKLLPSDTANINALFKRLRTKWNHISNEAVSINKELKENCDIVKDDIIEYWQYVTGCEMLTEEVPINMRWKHIEFSENIKSSLVTLCISINDL